MTTIMTTSCSTDALEEISGTWQFEGLEGIEVIELRAHNGYLYAGTEQGMYRTPMNEVSWQSLNLSETTVQTFAVFTGQEILASVYFNEADSSTIVKTTDGGESWVPFRNGFGGESRITPRVFEIHPDNPDILFARGFANVAKSTDRGLNWESVYLDWGAMGMNASLLKINPDNPDKIWAGGSSGSSSAYLVRTVDGGANWEHINLVPGEVNPMGVASDILINQINSDHLVLATKGFISQYSRNNGESWKLSNNEIAIRVLENSILNDRLVFGSGTHPTGSLSIAASSDFGKSWDTLLYEESPPDVVVNDMAVDVIDRQETILLGTNKGVFSFRVD